VTAPSAAPLGPDEVRRIAALARLRLSDEEAARFASQFTAIVAHLDSLRAVDTTGVEPLDHPLPLTDVLRDDAPRAGLSRYDALCRAPDATSDSFRVPPGIARSETDAG
jgi:aspartyl-tRNA(Asn)/glutamyl-tRNA(Gln) amidotransferase subunit C